MTTRRQLLKSSALALASTTFGAATNAKNLPITSLHLPSASKDAKATSQDEAYWRAVAKYYKKANDIINLEHGYWGKMSTVVEQAFINKTQMVNKELSYYARKQFNQDLLAVKQLVASALGAQETEIALTRNATESFVCLLNQYNGLQANDTILWADVDYPPYQKMMSDYANRHSLNGVRIILPSSGKQQDYLEAYEKAFSVHKDIKIMLLTHASNQHGLVLPVKEIAAIAKSKGIDVICDCAQSWGLVDFKMDDLDVDWAIFNLHKWIGTPVGVGALYMRNGSREKILPHIGEPSGDESTQNRVHPATVNFAAFLAVPEALEFHFAIGAKNKYERLKYLRRRWVEQVRHLKNIEVLGAIDDAGATGMAGFRLKNKTSVEEVVKLQQGLEQKYGILTVVRKGLASGANIRVTPQIFTQLEEIDLFAQALIDIDKTV